MCFALSKAQMPPGAWVSAVLGQLHHSVDVDTVEPYTQLFQECVVLQPSLLHMAPQQAGQANHGRRRRGGGGDLGSGISCSRCEFDDVNLALLQPSTTLAACLQKSWRTHMRYSRPLL
jgi:hypothetical protein